MYSFYRAKTQDFGGTINFITPSQQLKLICPFSQSIFQLIPNTESLLGDQKMTGIFETKLAELGVTLPNAPAPAANYVPYVQVGDLVYVSGQVSQDTTGFIIGKLGDNRSEEHTSELQSRE